MEESPSIGSHLRGCMTEASLEVVKGESPSVTLMTDKYKRSIIVLLISKSIEPNKEQEEITSGFQQGNFCKH